MWMIYELLCKTKESSHFSIILTLNFLAEGGYKVSSKKAQIFQPIMKYLGFELLKGQWNLLPDEREALAWVAVPTTQETIVRVSGNDWVCEI